MEKTSQYLSIGHYSPLTIRNYLAELRFIFVYYPDADPVDLTEAMITQYLLYLAKTLECSRVKCKMAEQSISFFMRHVAKCPCVIPAVIYPRPSGKLPVVMLPEEIMKLIDGVQNIKHRIILMLLYSTGMRKSEIDNCRIADIDCANMRIKIGKLLNLQLHCAYRLLLIFLGFHISTEVPAVFCPVPVFASSHPHKER